MDSTAALPHSSGSRSVGIGVVVGLHVVAFSSALHRVSVPKLPDVTKVQIEPTSVKPPPPAQPIKPTQLNWTLPDPVPIPPPEVPVAAPPSLVPTVSIDQAVPRNDASSPPQLAPAGTHATQGVQSVGVACTKMQAPELPALGWSGEALFRVVAGTEAGRVTQVEIHALRGGMDSRTQRAVKGAIERALREGYVCPGNVRFSQEFLFRIE
ncbi:MAG: hypothetical protein JO369_07770 [Paucibacter sp.]|nr:hypothetical protein [Roseateles sp.]